MPTPFDVHLISTKEASDLSGYNPDYLARLCRSGKIVGRQVGRAWVVDRRSLEAFVHEQEVRKEERAQELSRQREAEYQKAQQPASSTDTVTTIPVTTLSPYNLLVEKTSRSLVFSPAAAFILSVVLVGGVAYAGNSRELAAYLGETGEAALALATSELVTGPVRFRSQESRAPEELARAYVVRTPSYAEVLRGFSFNTARTQLAQLGVGTTPRIDVQRTGELQSAELLARAERMVSDRTLVTAVTNPRATLSAVTSTFYTHVERIERGNIILVTTAGSHMLSLGTTIRDTSDELARTQVAGTLATRILDSYIAGLETWVRTTPRIADRGAQLQLAFGTSMLDTGGHIASLLGDTVFETPTGARNFAFGVVDTTAEGIENLSQPETQTQGWTGESLAALVARATPWFMPEPLYTLGERIAVSVYDSVQGLANRAGNAIATLFGNPTSSTELTVIPLEGDAPTEADTAAALSSGTVVIGNNSSVPAGTQGGTVIQNTYVTNTFQYTGSPVTQAAFVGSLDRLASSINTSPTTQSVVSALSASNLSISSLAVTTNANITDELTAGLITASGAINGAYFTAASVTATSSLPQLVSSSFALGNDYFTDLTGSGLVVTDGALSLSGSINSDLIPQLNNSYDLGSPALYWNDAYIDTLTVNSISAASSSIGGTASESLTINSDNASTDTEDMQLIFFRGVVNPNAVLSWNSTTDWFEFNQPALFWNQSSTTTIPSLLARASTGQTADIFQLQNSSGATLSTFTSTGALGIGTTSPFTALSVVVPTSGNPPAAYFGTIDGFGYTLRRNTTSGFLEFQGNQTAATGYDFQSASGASSLRIINSGDIGIGTTSPLGKLHVHNSANTNLYLTSEASESKIIYRSGSDKVHGWSVGSFSDGSFAFYDNDGGGTRLSINDNGNIGIGTSTPTGKLHIYQSAATSLDGLVLESSGNNTGRIYLDTAGVLNVQRGTTNAISINSSGNVGIGTTSPLAKLDVYGTNSTGDFRITRSGSVNYFYTKAPGGSVTGSELGINGVSNIFLAAGGNVGIGTTTPIARLAVAGSFHQTLTDTSLTYIAETQGPTPGTSLSGAYGVFIAGKYAYVANILRDSLAVIDISNPTSPTFVAETQGTTPGTTLDGARDVFVSGKYAYVVNQIHDSLAVIDISNPANPTFVGEVRDTTRLDGISSVYVSGRYAYVANQTRASLAVIDISNPTSPTFVAETQGTTPGTTLSSAIDVYVSGKYAYVANLVRDSLAVIDISNPANPTFIAETQGPTPGTSLNGAVSVVVSGKYAYIAAQANNSIAIIDVSNPASPTFVAETQGPTPGTSLQGANEVFLSGRYAYVANITRDSLAVIDIANPANPIFVGETQGTTPGTTLNGAHSVFVSGKYAYVAAQGNSSFAVIDLGGSDIANARIGALETGTLNITDLASVGNNLIVGTGLSVGRGGIVTDGHIAALGTTTASYFAGNVGIGTPSPGYKLDVAGFVNTDQYSGYKQAGNLFAYASSTNQATIFGLFAGGQNATTSATQSGTVAVGYQALTRLTTGTRNTAVGYLALGSMLTNSNNTAVGYQALQSATGGFNTAIGANTASTITSGTQNVGIGAFALSILTSGTDNVAIGVSAMGTAGSSGAAQSNIAIGSSALGRMTTGSSNIGIGYGALQFNTAGAGNTAIGYTAQEGVAGFNGSYNTTLGFQTGGDFSGSASYNVLIGQNVRAPSAAGSRQLNIGNVIFGTNLFNGSTPNSAPVADGNIGIGTTSPYAQFSVHAVAGATNYALFAIGSSTASATTTHFVVTNAGTVGIGTTAPTAQLHTTGTVRFSNFGTGTLQTDADGNVSVSSDERLKDISGSFSRGLADIQKLNPILYRWNATSGLEQQGTYAGFSAQNVHAAIPEAVGEDKRGFLTLQDRPILAAAVNAIKDLAGQTTELSVATTSLAVRLADVEEKQKTPVLPTALTATVITAESLDASDSITAVRMSASGSISAGSLFVPQAPASYEVGSSTLTALLPADVLTDGGQVDVYKLATYTLATVQNLVTRFDSLTLRVDTIEERLATLESATSTPDSISESFFTMFNAQKLLATVGVAFEQNVMSFTDIVARKFTAGTAEMPTGITLYDQQTGEPYCLSIKNGAQQIIQGSCMVIDLKAQQLAQQMAEVGTGGNVASSTASSTNQTLPVEGGTPEPSDTVAPTIALNGEAAVEIDFGSAWNDPGATADDDIDGDITSLIVVQGAVNVNAPGLYTISYSATDAAGNTSEASRTVVVKSTLDTTVATSQ